MTESAEPYLVECHACTASFDALSAAWCTCLVSERTLVCPACQKCSCRATPAYKQRFWRGAPRALWDRKFAAHNQPLEDFQNPAPEAALRPLVLLVDDERDIRRVATQHILSLGYGLIVARNGAEGLDLAGRFKPDLVLSDALMPQMDGRDLARAIKQEPELAKTKVVVMTSLFTSEKDKNQAFNQVKVDDYLAKPLDPSTLRELLRRLIGPPFG